VLSGWGGDGMGTWGWIGGFALLVALALLVAGGVLLARTSRPPVVRHPAVATHAPRGVLSTRAPEAGQEHAARPPGAEAARRTPSHP
jgi:hypothetical protein